MKGCLDQMKRILPTINTGIGNLPEKCRVNSRTCSQRYFLKMSLYLKATLPTERELFLNTAHPGIDCNAVKNYREYIEKWIKVSFWHVIALHHCSTDFTVRLSSLCTPEPINSRASLIVRNKVGHPLPSCQKQLLAVIGVIILSSGFRAVIGVRCRLMGKHQQRAQRKAAAQPEREIGDFITSTGNWIDRSTLIFKASFSSDKLFCCYFTDIIYFSNSCWHKCNPPWRSCTSLALVHTQCLDAPTLPPPQEAAKKPEKWENSLLYHKMYKHSYTYLWIKTSLI